MGKIRRTRRAYNDRMAAILPAQSVAGARTKIPVIRKPLRQKKSTTPMSLQLTIFAKNGHGIRCPINTAKIATALTPSSWE